MTITARQLARIQAGGYATETDLVRACIDWLKSNGCMIWRQNQGGMKMAGDGPRRFIRFAHINGISDVIGLTPTGRFICVEAKQPGGKPTVEQEAFLAAVRANGGIALVVHSLDELAEQYRVALSPA